MSNRTSNKTLAETHLEAFQRSNGDWVNNHTDDVAWVDSFDNTETAATGSIVFTDDSVIHWNMNDAWVAAQ